MITTTLENGLAVSYEVKYTLSLQPRDYTPGYLPKRNENLHLQKNLNINVQLPKLETAQVSFSV